MVKFKKGVKINGIKPEMLVALVVANEVYAIWAADCIVTSVTEGKHKSGSLHHVGYGMDLRTRHINESTAKDIAKRLRERLTDEFDIIVEKDHIHMEFQP